VLNTAQVINRSRNAVDDGGTNQTFPDDEMTDHLAEVVLEYSTYRPYAKKTTFTTTQGQDIYDLTTTAPDMAWVDRVYNISGVFDIAYLFNATGVYSAIDVFSFLRYVKAGDRNLFTIRDDMLDLYQQFGQIIWSEYNENQIILYPAPPETGVTIGVDYFAIHITDNNGNYPTIPAKDETYIRNLMEAKLLDIIANVLVKKGSYEQGQTKVTYDPDKLRGRASALRTQTLTALDDGFVGRG
jgi:hypothetical protein